MHKTPWGPDLEKAHYLLCHILWLKQVMWPIQAEEVERYTLLPNGGNYNSTLQVANTQRRMENGACFVRNISHKT